MVVRRSCLGLERVVRAELGKGWISRCDAMSWTLRLFVCNWEVWDRLCSVVCVLC